MFRGYLGDEAAPPVFREGSNVDIGWRPGIWWVAEHRGGDFGLRNLFSLFFF